MWITLGDLRLHCDVQGSGEPVLFVHGFPLCGAMWTHTAHRLADRWKCIIPDLRGHGRSDASAVVTITDLADDLAALLERLEERRPVVLVGLSLGGVVAFEFFRRHRDRLRALALVDTRATPETPEGVIRRQALAEQVLKEGSHVAADAMINTIFAPTASAELRQQWHTRMAQTIPTGVAATARALAERPDSRPTLARIDCPTVLIVGSEDALTPVDLMREMHAAIRGSQLVIIPGAGHVPPVEQPERFAAALRAFLEQLG